MRQIVSSYNQFPHAIEWPEIDDAERHMARTAHWIEWVDYLGLKFNVDYIAIVGRPIGVFGGKMCYAKAFKSSALALQFKIAFAGS